MVAALMRRSILLVCSCLALPLAAGAAPADAPTAQQLIAPDAAPLPGTPPGETGTYDSLDGQTYAAWRSDDGSILALEVGGDVIVLQSRMVSDVNDVTASTTTTLTQAAAALRFRLWTGVDPSTFTPAGAAPASPPFVLRFLQQPTGITGIDTASDFARNLPALRRAFPGAVSFGSRVHGLPLGSAETGRNRMRGFPPTVAASDTGVYETVSYGAVDASLTAVGPQVSIFAARRGTGAARSNATLLKPRPDLRVAGLAVTLRAGGALFRHGDLVVLVTAFDWRPTRADWRSMLGQLR